MGQNHQNDGPLDGIEADQKPPHVPLNALGFSPELEPEQQNLIVVSTRTLRQAEKRILSCEHCSPADAEIPFDWILDDVTGADSATTDYIMESPAICPCCCRDVVEKTLVEPA